MRRWLTLTLIACSGDEGTDKTIVPLDEADADADADADTDTDADADTDADTDPGACAPLAHDPGTSVAAGADLAAAIAGASAGDTLVLADGTYNVSAPLVVDRALTIVSASGDRSAVVIDGQRTAGELVRIAASDVRLAHLTLARSAEELIRVEPDGAPIDGTVLHDLRLLDPGSLAVAVRGDGADHWSEGGELACSSVELTDAGRDAIQGECATGGIDAEGARAWTVRDSRFEDLWCERDAAGPAVRFWRGSRDISVDRNVMADVSRGIALGESRDQVGRLWSDQPCGQDSVLQAIDSSATNNIVFANATRLVETPDAQVYGIIAESSCNVTIVHNSVYSPGEPEEGSIHHRYGTTSGVVANNLVSFDVLRLENSTCAVSANVENAAFDTWYFPAQGDFHTAPGAVDALDQGDPAHSLPVDIDGELRDDGKPDVGADER